MDKEKLADVNRYAQCANEARLAKPGLDRHFWNAHAAYWIACALADKTVGEYHAARVATFYDKRLNRKCA